MCLPLTVKGPPMGPLIVPLVVVPSPQSMVAEYSTAVELGSGSVKVATVPLNSWPSVALKVVPCAVICCSVAATQVLDAVAQCSVLVESVKQALIVSVPPVPLLAYVKETFPLASVLHVAFAVQLPPAPAFGPAVIVKDTVVPTTGFPLLS